MFTVWKSFHGRSALSLLTLKVLSGSCQQLVKNVEGALIFGLTDGSGFL